MTPPWLKKFQQELDNKPTYVRIILFVLLIIVTYLIWKTIFWRGLQTHTESISKQKIIAVKTISTLKTAIIKAQQEHHKSTQHSKDQKKLAQQKQELQKKLMAERKEFVSRDDVTNILKELIAKKHDLKLLNLQISQPQDLGLIISKFRILDQKIDMTFIGNYFSTLDYLKEIEALHWPILWNKLSYRVTKHPQAEIKLTIHTFSKGKEAKNA
jgi:hypothetical protein